MKVHSMWLGCGCLLMAATVSAVPTVSGANEAISIVKTNVASANGFQLLCVPVVKLDISGRATKGNITLAEMFPPASYRGAEVTVLSSSTQGLAGKIYTVAAAESDAQWKENTTLANATEFPAGTTFWLKNGPATSTLFFGGTSGQTIAVPASAGMFPIGNAASAAVKIREISGTAYDRLLVLAANSNEYVNYTHTGTAWVKGTSTAVGSDAIAAGEAFFYYKASR
ncbi:MAG: hypothetical protein RR133_04060 [Kiritimatiellia bacterium]